MSEIQWSNELTRLQRRRDALLLDLERANSDIANHIHNRDNYIAYKKAVREVVSPSPTPRE